MKKFMKKRMKNNQGFSLVELIIVIAIMAILMGVVGTQVVPYLEKSRQATDNQLLSTVGTSSVSSFATQAGKLTAGASYKFTSTKGGTDAVTTDGGNGQKVLDDIKEFVGASGQSICTYLQGKMESKKGKTMSTIEIEYNGSDGKVTVTAFDSSSNQILEQVISK